MSQCIVCRTNKAEVPDRERMGRPVKRLCRGCHVLRLQSDLIRIMNLEAKKEKEKE